MGPVKVSNYLEQTADPQVRERDYRRLVQRYYDTVTFFYQYGWGECFHFAPFFGTETLRTALLRQEQELAREAGLRAGMAVLDVGCGIGGPARNFARLTQAHITGITISAAQVKTARRLTRKQGLSGHCVFLQMDAMTMSFPDAAFDAVVSMESGCHMPDKAAFYAECTRVLKPGGILAGWDWIQTGCPLEADRRQFIEPICRYFALPTLSTLEQIKAHLAHAGLEVLKTEDHGSRGSSTRTWAAPLQQRLNSPIVRLASRLSGTVGMMQRSGELLVNAGKAGYFSPLGFFAARQPAGRTPA
jgi:cyclopropane fatty-acyl-phospholipid synthase-like methyltransferase